MHAKGAPSACAAPNNLPLQLSSFVGREREMAEVKRLLSTSRLVTLTGVGGGGKTRLALEVAAGILKDAPTGWQYEHGIWFVGLASLADPVLVPQAVAKVLGVPEQPGRVLTETLCDYLRAKELLLILDNCEHLIEACAQLAETLLQACPRLTILATSREALNISGETVFHVPSLSTPPLAVGSIAPLLHEPTMLQTLTQYEDVRLFVERAVSAQSSFRLTQHNAPAVMQICQRLDGIPLAIELAAARLRAFTIAEVAARLDDRFQLLTGGSRTLPRHQTLRAAINWSYDLLSEPERVLFRQLSVFAGGWALEAAEAVCGAEEVPDLLTQLVGKSLVLAEERDSATRYRFLEPIRQYAREKLQESGEEAQLRLRHFDYYLQFAEHAASYLLGAHQLIWLARLEGENENLRAALGWTLEQREVSPALRLCAALRQFWRQRSYFSEGRQWLIAALALARPAATSLNDAERAWFADALGSAGALAWMQADYELARALSEESLVVSRALGDSRGAIETLSQMAIVAILQGDFASAQAHAEESLTLSQAIGYQRGVGRALTSLGFAALAQGDYASAHPLFERSLAITRELGDKLHMSSSITFLGHVALARGDYPKAWSLLEEGLTMRRELGDQRGVAISQAFMGLAASRQGDHALGRAHLAQSLPLFQLVGEKHWTLTAFVGLVVLLRRQHQWESLAKLLGALAAMGEREYGRMEPLIRSESEQALAATQRQLDRATFSAAWDAGHAMTLEQTIAYALELLTAPEPPARPPTPRQTAKQEFGGLTAREREVAALIAQGKTSREIAKTLVLSERTVEGHVGNILNKLGFSTRAQIAAWAAHKGLVK